MRKALVVALALAAMVQIASAQPLPKGGMSVTAAPEIALPVGDFGDIASLGIGAVATLNYGFNEKIVATASLGFLQFFGKEKTIAGFTVNFDDTNIILLVVGAKYFIQPNLYAGGDIGLYRYSGGASPNEIGITPLVGYKLNVANVPLDLQAQWVLVDGGSHLGVRVGYTFPVK